MCHINNKNFSYKELKFFCSTSICSIFFHNFTHSLHDCYLYSPDVHAYDVYRSDVLCGGIFLIGRWWYQLLLSRWSIVSTLLISDTHVSGHDRYAQLQSLVISIYGSGDVSLSVSRELLLWYLRSWLWISRVRRAGRYIGRWYVLYRSWCISWFLEIHETRLVQIRSLPTQTILYVRAVILDFFAFLNSKTNKCLYIYSKLKHMQCFYWVCWEFFYTCGYELCALCIWCSQ